MTGIDLCLVPPAAEQQSYYQRFMADMCASARILDRVAEFGSLGGSITQYQDDFCQRLPTQDLQNRYRSTGRRKEHIQIDGKGCGTDTGPRDGLKVWKRLVG